MASTDPHAIGGSYCCEQIDSALLPAEPAPLSTEQAESLWKVFAAIGRSWKNDFSRTDSAGMRSSWFEFVTLRCVQSPSYLAEYENAVEVLAELTRLYNEEIAYEKLFYGIGPIKTQPRTRLEHCKCYVVNEFIKVQIVASGFRGFGGKNRAMNYNGFVRGTRYNRIEGVREFMPPKKNRRAK